jgi:hypothetical protein
MCLRQLLETQPCHCCLTLLTLPCIYTYSSLHPDAAPAAAISLLLLLLA